MAKSKTSDVKNLKPAPGYVLLEPAKAEQKTQAGIYLPDSHDEKPQEGKVLAVGATWTSEYGAQVEAPCKKGDKVIYKKWGGNEVKLGEIEYQFLKFEDILAIVN